MIEDTTAGGDTDIDRGRGARLREFLLAVRHTARFRYGLGAGVALIVIAVGAVIAFAAGPLPTWLRQQITSVVPSLPVTTSQAVLASILAGLGLVFLRYSATRDRDAGWLITETEPESPATVPRIAGAEFEGNRMAALNDIRLKRVPYEATVPGEKLRTQAIRITELSEQCTRVEATRAVDNGEWTGDPIARAFCSKQIAFPVEFRFLQWARPDIAYERAVARTSAAVSRYAEVSLKGKSASELQGDDGALFSGWLETVVTSITGEPNEMNSESETKQAGLQGENRTLAADRPNKGEN